MWMRMYPLDPPFRFAVLVVTSRSGPSHHRKVWHRFLCCCSCSVIRQDTVAEAVSSVFVDGEKKREREKEREDQFSPGQTKTEQQWRPKHGFPYRFSLSLRLARLVRVVYVCVSVLVCVCVCKVHAHTHGLGQGDRHLQSREAYNRIAL